jgi:hypothetical protein
MLIDAIKLNQLQTRKRYPGKSDWSVHFSPLGFATGNPPCIYIHYSLMVVYDGLSDTYHVRRWDHVVACQRSTRGKQIEAVLRSIFEIIISLHTILICFNEPFQSPRIDTELFIGSKTDYSSSIYLEQHLKTLRAAGPPSPSTAAL